MMARKGNFSAVSAAAVAAAADGGVCIRESVWFC